MRVHTDAEFQSRRQQRDALGARPVPARRGRQRVGGKRRVADTGVTTSPSRISIVAERVLSGRRAKLSVERNVQQCVQHENKQKAEVTGIVDINRMKNLSRSASPAPRFSTPLYDFVRFGTLLSARLLADEPFEIN